MLKLCLFVYFLKLCYLSCKGNYPNKSIIEGGGGVMKNLLKSLKYSLSRLKNFFFF